MKLALFSSTFARFSLPLAWFSLFLYHGVHRFLHCLFSLRQGWGINFNKCPEIRLSGLKKGPVRTLVEIMSQFLPEKHAYERRSKELQKPRTCKNQRAKTIPRGKEAKSHKSQTGKKTSQIPNSITISFHETSS